MSEVLSNLLNAVMNLIERIESKETAEPTFTKNVFANLIERIERTG